MKTNPLKSLLKNVMRNVFTPYEHYPELEGTRMRSKYSKEYPLRTCLLTGLNVNPSLVKSDDFFKLITGFMPVDYALQREANLITESVEDDVILIVDTVECTIRSINRINFTRIMEETFEKGDVKSYLTKADYVRKSSKLRIRK